MQLVPSSLQQSEASGNRELSVVDTLKAFVRAVDSGASRRLLQKLAGRARAALAAGEAPGGAR